MHGDGNIALISVRSDLDVNSVDEVRASIDRFISQGSQRIILNLANAHYVDSAGMGLIIFELKKLRAKGGLLSLAGVSPEVYRSLVTLRISELMPIEQTGKRPPVPELDPSSLPLKRVTLPVGAQSLSETRRRIQELLSELPLSADAAFDLNLATGEAIGNAIDHACAEGAFATIAVYSDRVIIEVEDCGRGFDPAFCKRASVGSFAERGRGITLMHLLTDSVSIVRRPQGKGMLVRLVKLIT